MRGGGTTYDDGGVAGRPHGKADHTGLLTRRMAGMGDHDDRRGGSSLVLLPMLAFGGGLDGLHDDSGLLLRDRSGRELDADVGLAVAGAGDVAGRRVDDGHGLR